MGRMTECAHCGRPFVVDVVVGRPRKYCRRSCRQRAFEARRHGEDLAWSDARIVQMSRQLAELEDRLDRVRGTVEELRAEVDDVGAEPQALLDDIEAALEDA